MFAQAAEFQPEHNISLRNYRKQNMDFSHKHGPPPLHNSKRMNLLFHTGLSLARGKAHIPKAVRSACNLTVPLNTE